MQDLFEELKRRKVFRVAAVYAVVAWLLIQVAATIMPALQMPGWTVSFVTILFILGFPIALVLSWAYDITPEGIKEDAATQSPPVAAPPSDRKLIYATFVLVLLVAGFQIADRFVFPSSETASTNSPSIDSPNSLLAVRSSLNLGQQEDVMFGKRVFNAISPNGARVAYIANQSDGPHLYLRELNQLLPRDLGRLNGNSTTTTPYFSPDSQQIAYRDGNNLMRISIDGDSPQILVNGLRDSAIAWESNRSILYSDGNDQSLRRIASVGGMPERVQLQIESEEQQLIPHVLPGGNALLYNEAAGRIVTRGIRLARLDTGEVETLIDRAYAGRYASSGHIVFMRASTLWVVPFDLERLEITGPEVPIIQGIESGSLQGLAAYSFSDDGRLVYDQGEDFYGSGDDTELVWMYRDGREESLGLEPNQYAHPQVSPNGEFISVTVPDGNGNSDVWVQDLRRGQLTRRTFSGAAESAIWSPGSEYLYYGLRERAWGIWRVPANGTGEASLWMQEDSVLRPETLSPDGDQLLYRRGIGDRRLYLSMVDDMSDTQPLFAENSSAAGVDLSPDGRWIAYHSFETGKWEVYVRPFPNVDDWKWQVSNDGGQEPKWGPEGNELFYISKHEALVEVHEVPVETGSTFTAGNPTTLFVGDFAGMGALGGGTLSYDVSSDGQRFLMSKYLRPTTSNMPLENLSLVMVDNWFEELRRLAPPSSN